MKNRTVLLKDIITTGEAANEIGVARITIIKAIVDGRLPARKFGREWMIVREDLRTYDGNRSN